MKIQINGTEYSIEDYHFDTDSKKEDGSCIGHLRFTIPSIERHIELASVDLDSKTMEQVLLNRLPEIELEPDYKVDLTAPTPTLEKFCGTLCTGRVKFPDTPIIDVGS